MRLKGIDRNQAAVTLAILAAVSVILAPILAIIGIWQGDPRWEWTAGAMLLMAAALYFIATQLFDDGAK